MIRLLWRLSAGYRLRPWRSPYLCWRMETYWGMHAANITFAQFWKFAWSERRELRRYLEWAEGMRKRAEGSGPTCYERGSVADLNRDGAAHVSKRHVTSKPVWPGQRW